MSMNTYERHAPLMQNIHYFLKWTLISGFIGLIVGLAGGVFGKCVSFVTKLWT